jgi:hypothetical protein
MRARISRIWQNLPAHGMGELTRRRGDDPSGGQVDAISQRE